MPEICRVCRKEEAKLSFEHVPPRSAFNAERTTVFGLEHWLNRAQDGTMTGGRIEQPPKLVEKKVYLAGGVAAAFECKTTLTAAHIEKATETAAAVRRLVPSREGSAYRELFSPIVFGVLAHSHTWKGVKSTPKQNITSALRTADGKFAAHPRETLDLVTVADLGTWATMKIAGLSSSLFSAEEWETVRKVQGFPPEGGVGTSVMEPTPSDLGRWSRLWPSRRRDARPFNSASCARGRGASTHR